MAVTTTNYKSFHNSDKIMNHKVEAWISPNIVPQSYHLIFSHPLQLLKVPDIERKSLFKIVSDTL